MMKDTISYARFMDMPLFEVADIETFIVAVFVGFISQIPMELKDKLLEAPFKLTDI